MSTWPLSSKEMLQRMSPSTLDGMAWEEQERRRYGYCRFLKDLGKKLEVSNMIVCTAIIFCHRFYGQASFKDWDEFVLAESAMLLASKVEEAGRRLKDIVVVSYVLRHASDQFARQRIKRDKELYSNEKNLVLAGELKLLTALNFEFGVQAPHKALVPLLRKYGFVRDKAFVQRSWNFLNDGMMTTLILQYTAEQIAAAVLYMVVRERSLALPDRWWQDHDLTPEALKDICNQVFDVYNKSG